MNDSLSYELVHSPTPGDLSIEVEKRIGDGWWPLGTPFVHGEHYIQAMVHSPSTGRIEIAELTEEETVGNRS